MLSQQRYVTYPWYDEMAALPSVGVLPQTHNAHQTLRKTSDKPRGKRPVSYLTSNPQTVKVIKESLRDCYSLEKPKDTWQLRKCGVLDGTPEQKRTLGEN